MPPSAEETPPLRGGRGRRRGVEEAPRKTQAPAATRTTTKRSPAPRRAAGPRRRGRQGAIADEEAAARDDDDREPRPRRGRDEDEDEDDRPRKNGRSAGASMPTAPTAAAAATPRWSASPGGAASSGRGCSRTSAAIAAAPATTARRAITTPRRSPSTSARRIALRLIVIGTIAVTRGRRANGERRGVSPPCAGHGGGRDTRGLTRGALERHAASGTPGRDHDAPPLDGRHQHAAERHRAASKQPGRTPPGRW